MAKIVRTVEVTPRLIADVQRTSLVCFLCKWMHEDLLANGKLTGYPFDYTGAAVFPVSGKIKHLEAEGFISVDNPPGS